MKTKHFAFVAGGLVLFLALVVLWIWPISRPSVTGPVAPRVSAGDGHAVAVAADGYLYGWGRNDFGQAGFGQAVTQWVSPRIFIFRATNWARVATGDNHSLGIRMDGSLWSWGRNDFGQMGIGRYDSTSSASGMPSMRPSPIRVGLETNWAAIAGGVLYSVALKTDGTLWTWGGNWAGQLGDGAGHPLCALFSNYDLASRSPKTNSPAPVGIDRDWMAVASGTEHVLALKTNGSLWAWGRNDCGQLGDGTLENRGQPTRIGSDADWLAIAAGGGFTGGHSVALKKDGSLWIWGNYCPKATLTIIMGAALATQPTRVGSDHDWKQIAAGDGLTLAVKKNGTLWALGLDCSSMVGKPNSTISQLTQVGRASDWVGAAAEGPGYFGGRSAYCTYGLKADGSLWVWGGNLRRAPNKKVQMVQNWLAKLGIRTPWLNGLHPWATSPSPLLHLGVKRPAAGE